MIHVIATIKAQDGQRENLIEAFENILPFVREKKGCIEYSLTVNLESGLEGQSPYDDRTIILVEKWININELENHINDPKYQDWFDHTWHLILSASMQILTDVA